MRKLLFRSRSGEGYPMVIAVTLCLLMLFMVIAEYFRVNIIVQGVRDAVQQAVIATVNENYDDVYHSVREGYAAGWFPEGDGEWFESIDAGDIYGNLSYTMGGAKSHDIEDGILEPDAPDFEQRLTMLQRKPRARYRVNHISWWAQELPSDEEYAEARRNLNAVGWQVDYIITHCAPTSIALMGSRHNEADRLTDFLQEVRERAKYHYWLFGHYHDNRAIDEKHILLWEQIVRII